MLPGFFLALREGIEAALLISVILGTLRKTQKANFTPIVWIGTLSAVVVSGLLTLILNVIGASFEGKTEEIFEGITMLFASVILTWVIFWMRHQAQRAHSAFGAEIQRAVMERGKGAFFLLSFISVLREGIELGLFLTAATFSTDPEQTLLGAGFGLIVAIFLGWALFTGLVKLDLRRFFLLTGALLILFAAGLMAHGIHELNEAGLVPTLIDHVWDVNRVLDEQSTIGELLKALFGYNANPSLTEVIAYVGYFIAVLIGLRWLQFNPKRA